jgi:hypothetical protein
VDVGDNIIITGENFIEKKEFNQVWFGGNVRGVVDSATTTQLFLKVPEGALTDGIIVSNGIYADTSYVIVVVPAPIITYFIPEQGYEDGVMVYINGKNFGSKVTVTMNGGIEFQSTVNKDQISFILPKGAETGKICIKNSKEKTGCSDKEFKVLKGESDVTYSLSGVKILEETIRTSYSASGGGSYYDIDTTTALKTVSEVGDIKRGFKGQIGASCYIALPDSILQNYTYNGNENISLYKTVEYSVDSVQKVFRYVTISQYQHRRYSSGSGFHDYSGEYCNKHIIKLTQVPYTKSNGKYSINLKGNQVWQYITSYTINNYDSYYRNGGSPTGGSIRVVVPRLHEVLPEASFELTLE